MTSEQIKDYFEGMRDAEHGVQHTEGRSAEYTKGYSDQYAYEQKHRGTN